MRSAIGSGDWTPGRAAGKKREQQRNAGAATLVHLREHGSATASEFKTEVEPNYPVEGQSTSTWWKKSARPALDLAREAGAVSFEEGTKLWKWVAEE